MPDIYFYSAKYEMGEAEEVRSQSVTVMFCEDGNLNIGKVKGEVRNHFNYHFQTDEILIVGPNYASNELQSIFIENFAEAFEGVPTLHEQHLRESIRVYAFDKDGKLECLSNGQEIAPENIRLLLNIGLTNIFVNRGGLIEASGEAHHFIFPSGKHCNKFLRTGNILLHSSEIYFIAFNLLGKFNEEDVHHIFCDTSSISSIAMALIDLKRRFFDKSFPNVSITSFSSYSGLLSSKTDFSKRPLILISASTSGDMLSELARKHSHIARNQIVILYFLGSAERFDGVRDNVVCNLTKDPKRNPKGIEPYQTYLVGDCIYCERGSHPVKIEGDLFMLEKPKINRITIRVSDAPKRTVEFVKQFTPMAENHKSIFRVNYKERRKNNEQYELYFDMFDVLCAISNDEKRFSSFKSKLHAFFHQYIPANTIYLICLPDQGSEKLAEMIREEIKGNYRKARLPEIVPFDKLGEILKDENKVGAVVIVGSCISNGKNLLYLSRYLRPFSKLRLLYFIGLVRMLNEASLEFLKKNLKQGAMGSDTHSFIAVESYFCNSNSASSPWVIEYDKLLSFRDKLEDTGNENALAVIKERIDLIQNGIGNDIRGLDRNLFYKSYSGEPLALRKGFAFIDFKDNFKYLYQSDVYFIISAILNHLRNSSDLDQCLVQSEYVRNVLDPGNFNRYNDGIIQASILRSARREELCYDIDAVLSQDMTNVLIKIIEDYNSQQGEGILEFLYAIVIQKLILRRDHLNQIVEALSAISDHELIVFFRNEISESLKRNPISLVDENKALKLEIGRLQARLTSERTI